MIKKINALQKINNLEMEVHRLKNVVKGYKKAIKQVREQRNKLILNQTVNRENV